MYLVTYSLNSMENGPELFTVEQYPEVAIAEAERCLALHPEAAIEVYSGAEGTFIWATDE